MAEPEELEDDNDEESAETPEDVVELLGFDPLDTEHTTDEKPSFLQRMWSKLTSDEFREEEHPREGKSGQFVKGSGSAGGAESTIVKTVKKAETPSAKDYGAS